MQISTNPTTEECRSIECAIAEKLMGYRRVSVGKDCEGKNEGEVLIPPTWGNGGGYTDPPRRPIALWHHVPRWTSDEKSNWNLIEWMRAHSVRLNISWSKGDLLWEVCWESEVRGSQYYSEGLHADLKLAVCECVLDVAEAQ